MILATVFLHVILRFVVLSPGLLSISIGVAGALKSRIEQIVRAGKAALN